ncbi:MAG: hypothetical protein ABI705_07430 [Aestuariivirga sp.]
MMKEYSSNPKIKTLKLVSVLLMATFLQVGTAHSEGGLGGALGGLGDALGGGGSSGGGSTGGALGGLGNTVGNTLGGVTGGVNKTLNGVTSNIANTTTKLGIFDSNGALSLDGRSDLTDSLMAKASVLSPKQLAKLCLSAGGDKACGSGNKPQILGLVDAKLNVLSDGQLLSLCAGVGGGCGGSSITIGGGGGGGGNGDGGNGGGLGGMSRGEVVAYKKRCVSVLSSPQRYESGIVSLCRLIKRQRV